MAYSSETCSPTVEEMDLLAATASEVPDPPNNSLAFSGPGTSYDACYIETWGTIFGLHMQTPLLLLK